MLGAAHSARGPRIYRSRLWPNGTKPIRLQKLCFGGQNVGSGAYPKTTGEAVLSNHNQHRRAKTRATCTACQNPCRRGVGIALSLSAAAMPPQGRYAVRGIVLPCQLSRKSDLPTDAAQIGRSGPCSFQEHGPIPHCRVVGHLYLEWNSPEKGNAAHRGLSPSPDYARRVRNE
jgi:hypothetical protein